MTCRNLTAEEFVNALFYRRGKEKNHDDIREI